MMMLLWSIEPKINWNRLLPTIESKNLLVLMILSNSGKFYSGSESRAGIITVLIQGALGREHLLHGRAYRGPGFRVCRRLLWKEEDATGRTHLHGMGFNSKFALLS